MGGPRKGVVASSSPGNKSVLGCRHAKENREFLSDVSLVVSARRCCRFALLTRDSPGRQTKIRGVVFKTAVPQQIKPFRWRDQQAGRQPFGRTLIFGGKMLF